VRRCGVNGNLVTGTVEPSSFVIVDRAWRNGDW
jgi:hypothetical protein